ncbi:MAG: hypothetical protein WA064_05510 [Candidatus Moraniibacteriota bacterium]|jgi:hypothetical protein
MNAKKAVLVTIIALVVVFWGAYWTLTLVVAPVEQMDIGIKKAVDQKKVQIELDQKKDFLQALEIPAPSDGEKIRALRLSLRREIAELEKKISGDDSVVLSENHHLP